jgi:hypothetical protein
MSDDLGSDFALIEDPRCFDLDDLAVGVDKNACTNPL